MPLGLSHPACQTNGAPPAGTTAAPPNMGPVNLPSETTFVDLLGVSYAHIRTSDEGDLYLTQYGQPFWQHLLPENWYSREWFEANRERLTGTSTVYKVPTRPLDGKALQLVVKWSRVGEDVPLDTLTINKFIDAEFNSPFEEFSLLMELRSGLSGPPSIRVKTQKPLAIYVPSKRLQSWQTGRSEYRIAAKLARHPGVELDMLRQYVVLYGWIKGLDITEVADRWDVGGQIREMLLARATSLVTHELEMKGYRVVDMKPAHIIVRLRPDGGLVRDQNGQVVYALVDYELLERTPEHEQEVRSVHRQRYLQHMARRFEVSSSKPLPPHLKATTVLGVDYIFGHAESTGGALWVVGKDPDLFNYFLPERWRRTPKEALSSTHQVFKTRTKDNVNLVWRVSRMGDASTGQPDRSDAAIGFGYNSPFEEFAAALELSRAGVPTVYPRAIYMTGHQAQTARAIADIRRYVEFAQLRTPDGHVAMSEDHEYITIWGFWNGPDEFLARQDGQFYRAINAEQACRGQLLSPVMLEKLLQTIRERVAQAGFEDLNLKADHLLLSLAPDSHRDVPSPTIPPRTPCTLDQFEVRLCNFEFMRRRCATPA